MSTNDNTSTEPPGGDEALREYLNESIETPPPEEQIAQLRAENQQLRAEVTDLRDELTATKQTLFSELNDIRDRLTGQDPTNPRANGYYEDLTIIEKYSKMSPEERADLLANSSTKQRAVLIYQHWADWAREVDAGWLISTNFTRGAHGKTAIKIDLEQATGDDLQSTEVYRAMRMVAKLSAQERDDVEVLTDTAGRKHITGGAFEYHEMVNPDTNGTSRKFKVLKLVDPDGVSL